MFNKNQIKSIILDFEGVRPWPDASSGHGQGSQWGVIQRHQGEGSLMGSRNLGTSVRMSKKASWLP